jgi:ADP-heptose:LPS heptosyltransferase
VTDDGYKLAPGGVLRPFLAMPIEELRAAKRRAQARAVLRVGLCWAGNPDHKNDRNRSIGWPVVAPLLDIPVVWQALRHADPLPDARLLPLDPGGDWVTTAELMRTLDLVISVDTAVAHLAGTLNIPTWLLITAVPDFRWMLTRRDTPWYPSMTLYRQPAAGDWYAVVAAVQSDLLTLQEAHAAAQGV